MSDTGLWTRRAIAAVVALIAGLQLGLTVVFWRVMAYDLHMNDFGKFYYSARAFLEGADMYGPTVATAVPFGPTGTREFWNMNPPHFHLAILPLAPLPPETALAIWFAAGFFSLVLSLMLIAKELSIPWTPRNVFLATVAVLTPSSTGMVVLTGQVTFLLVLPLTYAWIAARHHNWRAAGIALGLAAGIKPFLGLFWFYLLMKRQVRAAIAMGAVIVLVVLAGLAVFGVDTYRSWLVVASRVDWVWSPMNASIAALLVRTFGDNPTFPPLVYAPAVVAVVSPILAVIVGGCTVWRMTRIPKSPAEDWAFAGLVFAALLVSPLGWMYYITLAAGPITALSMRWRSRMSGVVRLCVLLALPGLVVPPMWTAAAGRHALSGLTLGSIYSWSVMMLWIAVLVDSRHAARSTDRLEFAPS